MSRSNTTCLPMRHVLHGGVSLLFRNHSPWIEFGYAVSAYSAHTTGRDVTETTWSVDCGWQMRPDTRGVLPPRCDSLTLPCCYLAYVQQILIGYKRNRWKFKDIFIYFYMLLLNIISYLYNSTIILSLSYNFFF